jgi:hypothetical protein
VSNDDGWKSTDSGLPPVNVVVDTKIHDADGCRNEQPLKWSGRVWFLADGSMYVYYRPTHWREVQAHVD